MAKSKIACAVSALALVGTGMFVPMGALAEEVPVTEIATTAELATAVLEQAPYLKLTADLTATECANNASNWLGYFDITTTLDLNGHTITQANGCNYFVVRDDGNLTITGGGKIVKSSDNESYQTLAVVAANDKGGRLIVKDAEIDGNSVAVYANGDGAIVELDGGYLKGGSTGVNLSNFAKFTLTSGTVEAPSWGVTVFRDAEFIMNGGDINATAEDSIGVSGNGSASGNNDGTNAKLTLNAGTINSGDLGVYAPQINGQTVLGEGLAINAGKCGVEIRAGELSVEGATINVDAGAPYEFNPNGSGSTASGVAIAVAQHTTQQTITVTVSDGVFTAPVAFAEGNPQENLDVANQITLSITGGDFNATNGKPVVASEDITHFVAGGNYNKAPEYEYVKNGYTAYDNGVGYTVAVEGQILLPETIYLEVGETYDLKEAINESGFEYGDFNPGDLENYVEVDDEKVITGVVPGTAVVSWSLVDAYEHSFEGSATVVVYEVAEDLEDTDQIIDAIVNSEDPDNFEYAEGITPEDVMDAVENGDEIVAIVTSDIISEDDVDTEEVDAIEAEVEESLPDGAEVAGYYNIGVELIAISDDGTVVLGNISETNEPVWVTVALPEDLAPVASGYVRTYYMVYYHNGETGMVRAFDQGDGTILFTSKNFSTYALAYVDSAVEEDAEDEEETPAETATPDTGTMTVMGASAMNASLIAAIVTGILVAIVTFVKLSKISKR